MSQYGIVVNWGGPGRGTTAPATGEEGPASQSAGSFVSARQSERLSVRSALAIGQRGGRRALAGAGGGAMAGAQGGAGA